MVTEAVSTSSASPKMDQGWVYIPARFVRLRCRSPLLPGVLASRFGLEENILSFGTYAWEQTSPSLKAGIVVPHSSTSPESASSHPSQSGLCCNLPWHLLSDFGCYRIIASSPASLQFCVQGRPRRQHGA